MDQRFQQADDIESAPLQDEVILFHGSSNKFCVLNRTSSFIWDALAQPVTGDEIVRRLRDNFSEVTEQAAADIDTTIHEMVDLGLVVAVAASRNPQEEVNS